MALSTRTVVRGERRRRPAVALFGCFLLLVGLAGVTAGLAPGVRDYHWYGLKPTRWVLADLESTDAALSDRAWGELLARVARGEFSDEKQADLDAVLVRLFARGSGGSSIADAQAKLLVDRFARLTGSQQDAMVARLIADLGSNGYMPASSAQARLDALDRSQLLSTAQLDRIADLALAAQAAPKTGVSTDWLMNFLAQREADGKLSAARRDLFFDQAARPKLDARPDVVAGERLPFWVRYEGRGPQGAAWSHRSAIQSMWVDDDAKQQHGGSGSGSGFPNGASGTSMEVKRPGDHVLHVAVEVAVFQGAPTPALHDGKATPHWSKTFTLSTPFKALPAGTRDYVNLIDDPTQADAIRKAVKLELSSTKFEWLGLSVRIENPPMNLAFDVIARVGGNEYSIGHIYSNAGEPHGFGTGAFRDKTSPTQTFDKADIVLRSSESVARETVDLYEIWKGEIVYKDLPVKVQR